MANVSLWGANYSNVPHIDLPQTGGGTVRFYENGGGGGSVTQDQDGYIVLPSTGGGGGGGGDTWTWMGKNPTLVKDYGVTKVYLKDTGFASWSPTTTSTKIVDYSNMDTYTGADFTTYDYLTRFKFHTHFDYGSGATGANQISDYYYNLIYYSHGYYSLDYTDIVTDTERGASSIVMNSYSWLLYLNSSGANAYAGGSNTGVYPYTYYTPTVTSNNGSGSITVRCPQINAQCNNTYFSTTNAAAVNQNTSYYEHHATIYRVDYSTSDGSVMRRELRDMWLNGI